MSDQFEDGPLAQMESDIGASALKRFTALNGGLGGNVREIGASSVSKRMEALLKRAQELAAQAESLASQLSGPANRATPGLRPESRPSGDTVFGRQMAGLDEIAQVLDTLGGSLERAHRSLA